MSKLEEVRHQQLLSRSELARKANLSTLTILKIEHGRKCRPGTAKKIIAGLGYSIEEKEQLYKEIIGPYMTGNIFLEANVAKASKKPKDKLNIMPLAARRELDALEAPAIYQE
jgi:DNA-binding XRE family transcriptional regulator